MANEKNITTRTEATKAAHEKPESGRVFVYSALPQGHTFNVVDLDEKTAKNKVKHTVELRPAHKGDIFSNPSGKFSVTEVDENAWALVKKQHESSPILKSQLVFEAATRDAGDKMAQERSGIRRGLEPIDPKTQRAKKATDLT